MSLSPMLNPNSPLAAFQNPFHNYLSIVFGTTAIFLVGFSIRFIADKINKYRKQS
jgi:SSS family solute:Na+ symporter